MEATDRPNHRVSSNADIEEDEAWIDFDLTAPR